MAHTGCESLFADWLPSDLKKWYARIERCSLSQIGFPAMYRLQLSSSANHTILRPLFVFEEVRHIYETDSLTYFNKGLLAVLNDMSLSSTGVFTEYMLDVGILEKKFKGRAHIFKVRDIEKLEYELAKLKDIAKLFWKGKTRRILRLMEDFIAMRYVILRDMLVPQLYEEEGNLYTLLYIPTKRITPMRKRLRRVMEYQISSRI